MSELTDEEIDNKIRSLREEIEYLRKWKEKKIRDLGLSDLMTQVRIAEVRILARAEGLDW